MVRSYNRLTFEQRIEIEKLCKSEMSISEIARQLGKNYSTIYREIHRCPEGSYSARESENNHKKKTQSDIYDLKNNEDYQPCGKHFTFEDRKEIERMLREGKTLEEMALHFQKHVESVKREIRLCSGKYSAEEAEKIRQARKKKNNNTQNKNLLQRKLNKNELEYKKIIRACLRMNPKADVLDIKIATGMPIERVEKYYDELHQEVTKKA